VTPFGLGWPNVVSLFRIAVAPLLAVLILADARASSYLAAGIFVVAAATDGLDGYLARRYRAVTRTGQWLDPLADKILVSAPVVTLAVLGELPAWAAVVIVVREIGVSLLRVYLGFRGRSMPASRGAKVKTTLQLIAVTMYILPLGPAADLLKLSFLVAAVVLTMATGVAYGLDAWTWTRTAQRISPMDRPVR
jgi:CDP-diacylglycerol--glycerol-3-phosphate 3-phosphatidyltransferase